MAIDQFHLVLQFSIVVVSFIAIGLLGTKIAKGLSKPRGTYGDGLPERRKRKRLVLPDPATIQPRPVPPGTSI